MRSTPTDGSGAHHGLIRSDVYDFDTPCRKAPHHLGCCRTTTRCWGERDDIILRAPVRWPGPEEGCVDIERRSRLPE